MSPRVLAELLELDRRGLRRSALMTLLGDVPARRPDGRTVPTARWERIGRAAGVVREDDWHTHLVRYAEDVRDSDIPDPGAEAEAALELLAFVGELRAALGDPTVPRRWAEWVAWSKERLEWWFGPHGLDRLDGAEREGWDQTTMVLDRLDHLDSIGGPVTAGRVPRHVRRRARRHAGAAGQGRRRRAREHHRRCGRARCRRRRARRRGRGAGAATPDRRSTRR